MSLPLGDAIAKMYLVEQRGAAVARYRSGKVHIVDRAGDSGFGIAAKCGARLLTKNYQVSHDTDLGAGEVWCYSCLGNALEWIERDRAHAH